jgi:hypothetical protein
MRHFTRHVASQIWQSMPLTSFRVPPPPPPPPPRAPLPPPPPRVVPLPSPCASIAAAASTGACAAAAGSSRSTQIAAALTAAAGGQHVWRPMDMRRYAVTESERSLMRTSLYFMAGMTNCGGRIYGLICTYVRRPLHALCVMAAAGPVLVLGGWVMALPFFPTPSPFWMCLSYLAVSDSIF